MARLHNDYPESDCQGLRDIYDGWPCCGTGYLLQEGCAEKRLRDLKLENEPFFTFLMERIPKTQELFKTNDLVKCFTHCDAFLDNTLYTDDADAQMLALFDWEDSCVAPRVLDLAVIKHFYLQHKMIQFSIQHLYFL